MKAVIVTLALVGFMGSAYAAETMSESAAATAHDAKRAVKKGANRTKEALCMKDDAECLARKADNRLHEGADYTKDKAKEVKDKVD